MRSVSEAEVRIFSVWNEQLVNKSFIVQTPLTFEKPFGELEEIFENWRNIIQRPFCDNQTKILPHKFNNFLKPSVNSRSTLGKLSMVLIGASTRQFLSNTSRKFIF